MSFYTCMTDAYTEKNSLLSRDNSDQIYTNKTTTFSIDSINQSEKCIYNPNPDS